MANIEKYEVLNFSGGIRRDKGMFELQRNELLDARNVDMHDTGRVRTRRGSQQFGHTLSGTIKNAYFGAFTPGGSSPSASFLVNNNASTGVISRIVGARLTASITTVSTTVSTSNGGAFAASGTVEIDGDLIAYSGVSGDDLTGVTGIAVSHTSGAAINQWVTLAQSGTAVDAQMGVYYAPIGNTLIFAGRGVNMKQMDSSLTVTDVSNEPAALFLKNYRDRIYGAGDGGSGLNGSAYRVSFSNRGDGTTWTTASDYFDVNDSQGEYVTALYVHNDRLGIFKTNSTYTYDEIELKQRITNVGAYNQDVVQEINGRVYTFCPEGIFETNLYSAKQIGEPVRDFWQNFMPTFDATGLSRVCVNTFSASYGDDYLLFIGNITDPTATNNVLLQFDTKTRQWTAHDNGFANLTMLYGTRGYKFGSRVLNLRSALFGGGSDSKVWRFLENRYLDEQSTPVKRGTDIFQDQVSNTGTSIPSTIETPLYDFGQPNLFKSPKRLRVYAEQGQWTFEYRVENDKGVISQYQPLGTTIFTNHPFDCPKEMMGFRIGFRISSVNTASTSALNGFVFEDIEVKPRP